MPLFGVLIALFGSMPKHDLAPARDVSFGVSSDSRPDLFEAQPPKYGYRCDKSEPLTLVRRGLSALKTSAAANHHRNEGASTTKKAAVCARWLGGGCLRCSSYSLLQCYHFTASSFLVTRTSRERREIRKRQVDRRLSL